MNRFNILARHRHTLMQNQRPLRRRTAVIAAVAVIVAGGLVTTAVLVSNAGRAEQALISHRAAISHATDAELHPGKTGLGRAGAWHHYQPLY
jgi:hypothetical protein